MRKGGARRLPHPALSLANGLEFAPGGAAGQGRARQRQALAGRGPAAHLQHRAGQDQAALAQIGGGAGLALQHREHIECLQRRPDAAPDRLRAVGHDGMHGDAQFPADAEKAFKERARRLRAAHDRAAQAGAAAAAGLQARMDEMRDNKEGWIAYALAGATEPGEIVQ